MPRSTFPLLLSATLSATALACGSTTAANPVDTGASSTTSEAGPSDATGTAADAGGTPDAGGTGAATEAGDPDATPAPSDAATADTTTAAGDATTDTSSADAAGSPSQALFTTLTGGATPIAVTINQGTAIGEGALNGATPSTLANVAADSSNTQTIVSSTDPFNYTGTVPDTAAGFCDYSGSKPTRMSYVTGSSFETVAGGSPGADPMRSMAPFYFPLVYTSPNTTTGHAFGGKPPMIGLFDWRPKDIDEALVVAESDDYGQTWYFMQTLFELNPDYTNPISGGYSASSTSTGCPMAIGKTNSHFVSFNGATADDGWGHAAILQLPGVPATTGQVLYMLDRNTSNMPNTSTPIVDNAPLHAIKLPVASSKFPIWNTNASGPGNNDAKSISSAMSNTPGSTTPVVVTDTVGLLNPDGIMAVFPLAPTAPAGSAVTVLYVQKIVGGDNTGSTALPVSQQCTAAPVSGSINHDIANVRLATTTDGITFTDEGVVHGLSDPTTVDYGETRWVSPRGTLLDINGDGSLWGMYFAGGNCLDGDSDAFHFIGYAESTDKMSWVVYNDMNHPIASINTVTATNQANGQVVTVPANPPVIPTQYWFAERLYAPSAVRIDSTHLSLTFAGYGVQTPGNDLLDYRQIGNVVVTVSKPLPATTPNNTNAH